ncbi:MAG: transposase [Phycisphaerales bacterium]|nr:transposase [Phycisphaerales bacterium]
MCTARSTFITWHAKDNQPLLIGPNEVEVHRYLGRRAVEAEGVFVHAVNGMPDHVHMAVTVPPTLLIADWIGELKGGSSHWINHKNGPGVPICCETGEAPLD